ncbi:MAG TPA: M28 family peptidase [Blastocatellia bacterium]|nr:M28 family peptidase [Blastocatellia bacterium]
MLGFRKVTVIVTQLALVAAFALAPAGAKTNGDRERINAQEMKEWLTYLSSDEFEGRATFTEGLGLAAGYMAGLLKSWGVKPGGPNGSYFQRVAVLGVKSDNRSTVTVEANGQTRTFKNKEGISFPANSGGKRAFTADQIEFLGYGLNAPAINHNDFAGKQVKGKVVVYLGGSGPKGLGPQYRRALTSRSRFATEQSGAIATIGPGGGFAGGRGGNQTTAPGQLPAPDFTTAQRLDNVIAPAVSASDEFFEFLLSSSDVRYAELKEKASSGEPLPTFTLKNVKLTFNIDADYTVVRTQYTRNVIGIIEGSDAKLKETYVAYGSHYDHVGYSEGEVAQSENGARRLQPRGRVTAGAEHDRVWNGADDDGSGTVAMLAIAKAFAVGKKPRRSILLVWHSGEERGLWGSRYFVDYPTVPLDKIVAEINMDMVGRNRDNKEEEANKVYVVGSDRISTEFHNITVEANDALSKPLALDYEMNDPTDLEQIYYRSDHYSYAAKGIPVVFLTTGLHPDYHANTDHADKINYEKMTRISQYAYEIGARTANFERAPARDNLGPRAGRGSSGKL